MEQAATAITCFGMCFFPALFQTEDYAREIIKGIARGSRRTSSASG